MASHVGLSKTSVVEAAADLADTAGLANLSLAALAERLGVRTPTLYHYVAGLPGLRRAVALLSLREQAALLGQSVMGRAGADALQAMARAFREYILARPGRYTASVRAAEDPSDTELVAAQSTVVEIALCALAGYHLAPDDAIHAVRIFRAAVHGFATLEAAGGFGLPQAVDDTFARLIGAIILGIEGYTSGTRETDLGAV